MTISEEFNKLREIYDKEEKEYNDSSQNHWESQEKSRNEINKLVLNVLHETDLIKKVEWKLVISKYGTINLTTYTDDKKNSETLNEIVSIIKWDSWPGNHFGCNIDDGTELRIDDWDVRVNFEGNDKALKFLKKWNIPLEFDGDIDLDVFIDSHKESIETLEGVKKELDRLGR